LCLSVIHPSLVVIGYFDRMDPRGGSCIAHAVATKILSDVARAKPTVVITGGNMKLKLYSAATALILVTLAATASAQDWDRAVSLFNQKQYRAANSEFHKVLNANPDAWKSWYYIGAGHFALQSYMDSVDAFQN